MRDLMPPGWPVYRKILLTLVACHLNLVSIDNDYVVATVHVWCERWLVFATQTCCNNRCKTAQNNALGVDDDHFLSMSAGVAENVFIEDDLKLKHGASPRAIHGAL